MDDTTESQDVQVLLKRVYDAHRNALKESIGNSLKSKSQNQRLSEKNRQLCVENEVLKTENTRLQSLVSLKQSGSGGCCEVIRQSLETVISSYRQLLSEKESRIKQLEEDNRRLRQRRSYDGQDSYSISQENSQCTSRTSAHNQLKPVCGPMGRKSAGSENVASLVPSNVEKAATRLNPHNIKDTERFNSGIEEEDGSQLTLQSQNQSADGDGNQTVEDGGQKLKLQKKQTKRSRYAEEDVSPEVKRKRQISPDIPRKFKKASKDVREASVSSTVLVPDTCKLDLDETVAPDTLLSKLAADGGGGARSNKLNKFEESLMVIPETVPMDYDDSEDEFSEEDKETQVMNKKRFVPDLSDIIEQSGESNSQRTMTGADVKTVQDGDNSMIGENEKTSNTSARSKSQFSLRSVLASPDNCETSKTDDDMFASADGSDATLVNESEDDEEDTESCSQTFGRPKNMVKQKVKRPVEKESVGAEDDGRPSPEEHASKPGMKPLFKRRQKVMVDEQVLRRSPRKHKQSQELVAAGHTKKEQTEEVENNGSEFDPDATVAPDGGSHERVTDPSQSMDCYSVVPLKNGEPVSGKSFQVKVAKECKKKQTSPRRKLNSLSRKPVIPDRVPEDSSGDLELNFGEELNTGSRFVRSLTKSPLVANVASVLRSPSVGSMSDPESPLLLKVDGQGDRRMNQRHSGALIARQEKYAAVCSDKKPSPEQKHSKRLSSKSNKHKTNLKQTTLTQRFFHSPEKQGVIDVDDDEEEEERVAVTNGTDSDEDMQKALEVSGIIAQKQRLRSGSDRGGSGSDRGGSVSGNREANSDVTFKQPHMPVRNRARGHRKTVGETHHVRGEDRSTPLQEVTDHGNRGQRLNGSLDPAAELTQWCQSEQGTLGLNPSLSSFESDFCIEQGACSQPRTSTLAMTEEPIESQYIPSSSSSYKFGARKKVNTKTNEEDLENVPPVNELLDDSFDRPPRKPESNIARVAVVRKRDERQKLQGHGCKQCMEYYKAAGRSEEEAREHMHLCSRHRAEYVAPDTPPHFWSIGFMETQDCVDEDDLKFDEKEAPVQEVVSYRRRRRFNKCFQSKNETSTLEPLSQDNLS